MSIIIFAIIIIVVVALLVWGIDLVPQIAPFAGLLKLLVTLVAVLIILSKAGVV